MPVTLSSDAYGPNPYSLQSSNPDASAATATSSSVILPSGQDNLLLAPVPGYRAHSTSASQVTVDFNGDGHQDLLWRNEVTGQNVIWLMNGMSLSTFLLLPQVAEQNWHIQGAADFTGDGRTDILWRNYATGQNLVWMMNQTTLVTWLPLMSVTDRNWQIQGTGDFNGDGKTDILWRNYATGQNTVWLMNGISYVTFTFLPTVLGSNLRIQATGDFNRDGHTDILWRNYLSGENLIWLMNRTTLSTTELLMGVSDPNWQISGSGDFDRNGTIDIVWRNPAAGQNVVWAMNDLVYSQFTSISPVPDPHWRIALQDTMVAAEPVSVTNLSFSGREGDLGTFQIRLNQMPSNAVTLSLVGGNFVVVDADGNSRNGSQSAITFTPQDWYLPRTVSFVAEVDGTTAHRMMGNTISYSLAGGMVGNGVYELGSVLNTYAPDPTRFNIDLDFRNDYVGFWTPARRAIAQQAANDWAMAIANEWAGFQLNATINRLETSSGRPYSFTTNRYVDDLLIFVNLYEGSAGNEAALGGPDYEFGGWITSPPTFGEMPRVGQVAISPTVFSGYSNQVLYQIVAHEIGHVLGLLGLNWAGYSRYDVPSNTFRGEYARVANNGEFIPLQTQDGGDLWHPAARVRSIMSYGYLYNLSAPTAIDYAMLADSGYRIHGVNA